MSPQKKIDPIDKIQEFQQAILSKKPEAQDMFHEVGMMNFKIHPVRGDISDLDFGKPEFIDALWSLGKLDEFFNAEYYHMKDHEQDVFYRLIEEMRSNLQQQLNKVNISAVEFPERPKKRFEVEIVKDNNLKVH